MLDGRRHPDQGRAGRAGDDRPRAGRTKEKPRSARSLLALFLLALVAAAAGGIFVMKCERDSGASSERVTLP